MNKQRIAIVGSGISGLTCAYLLADHYQVTLYEKHPYLGGHAHTVQVADRAGTLAIDTGFVVFNDRTYPLYERLLEKLHIAKVKSEMSFSFSSTVYDLEYNGHNINTLFAQRQNCFSPKFYRMIIDIIKFNRDAKHYLQQASRDVSQTISQFCAEHGYGQLFLNAYLYPMISAIWSTSIVNIAHYPSEFLLNFFYHHGLLNIIDRPQWFTVAGGSQSYVQAISNQIAAEIVTDHQVTQVAIVDDKVKIVSQHSEAVFDKVILACHSDQALQLLAMPTALDIETLSNIHYHDNIITLHTDNTVMPKHPRAWASWNYHDFGQGAVSLTYYVNRLQQFTADKDYFVSVNCDPYIATEKIIKKIHYQHPNFHGNALKAQQNFDQINQQGNIHYCGAYWYNGFHEDGVKSAVSLCRKLGVDFV